MCKYIITGKPVSAGASFFCLIQIRAHISLSLLLGLTCFVKSCTRSCIYYSRVQRSANCVACIVGDVVFC